MPRRRRIEDLTGGSAEPPHLTPILAPGDDGAIPGEVVFALSADAAGALATSIPSISGRAALGAAATVKLGHDAIDKALARLDVQSIARVHGPSPAVVTHGVAVADDMGLDGTFRVRFGAGTVPKTVADRLSALDDVVWAEPNYAREASIVPNDPQYASQWGLPRINCPAAWDHTTGSAGVTVAVVDTGIDLNHPELAPLIVAGQDLVDWPAGSVPAPGYVLEGDYMGVDAVPQDEVGHGTHVAGTISCLSNNGAGVAGVNWSTRLMPVRVLARVRRTADNAISGMGTSANIAAGIRWAADHGARVINMSLGGPSDATVEREAVAYAVSKNVVVCVAMGNAGSAGHHDDSPSYPAAYPDVIAVGATDSTDARASFSQQGAHIAISGPGVGIQSTYWDDTYASLSGTSMATPHVAGVAALVLSVNPALTAAQVGSILRSTAKPLRDAPGDPVPNHQYGSGLVQADAAVAAAAPPPLPSHTVICHPSIVQLTCHPSLAIICQPSVIKVSCQVSQHIICQVTQPVTCVVSRATICPLTRDVTCVATGAATCNPSLAGCPSIACNSIACGSIGCHGPGPGPAGAQWQDYDPHGYDPYGGSYE